MKKMFLKSMVFLAAVLGGSSLHATPYKMMVGSGFSAPNVCYPTSNVGNAQPGDIVFDTCDGEFYGYYGGTGWNPLASGAGTKTPPTVQRLTTGSSNYTVPTPAPLYIKIRMVGGGGGGAGSGSGSTNGNAGGNTTFDTFLTAYGGGAGPTGGGASTAAGGSFSVGSPAVDIASVSGGRGGGGSGGSGSVTIYFPGGMGGSTPFGSTGASTGASTPSGVAGSGAGGAGAGSNASTVNSGGGGGGGGYIEARIDNPSAGATYAYCIGNTGSSCGGSTGAGGSSGPSGAPGGGGGSGIIIVEEYYQ